jgi:hypothetical protein
MAVLLVYTFMRFARGPPHGLRAVKACMHILCTCDLRKCLSILHRFLLQKIHQRTLSTSVSS